MKLMFTLVPIILFSGCCSGLSTLGVYHDTTTEYESKSSYVSSEKIEEAKDNCRRQNRELAECMSELGFEQVTKNHTRLGCKGPKFW